LNIGTITCTYFMRIYNYHGPDPLDWGAMCDKYRAEFTRGDFLTMAGEIKRMGFNSIEIWEPNFSYQVYTEADALGMAEELKQMGFGQVAYCIGGWSKADITNVEKAYRFAKALGARVVVGCISKPEANEILPEVEKWGKAFGMRYAIENHPEPNLASPEDIAGVVGAYETVGANLDTGIYNSMGYDVLAAADLLRDKVYHIHLKDTLKGSKGGCLPIGDGDAPLKELLIKARDWGYEYMVSVEYEYQGDPAPGLEKSIAYINKALCSK